ncbi:MAG: hypothetical protein MJ124_02700, partial [Lachnospiraceae bacterium]|nr:hypothetical protein [Lachnospiraceae bacterium]
IECSCISMKYLGEYMDIHCGGIDNIFPHHTNEIAQSEAYLGHKWCNYWFHVHHLTEKGGEKISKSKGTMLNVDFLISEKMRPIVYRMFALQSHYRKPLEFSVDNMTNVGQAYDKLLRKVAELKKEAGMNAAEIKALSEKIETARKTATHNSEDVAAAIAKAAEGTAVDAGKFFEFSESFGNALYNDINTSSGITVLYDVLRNEMNAVTKLALISAFDYVLSLDLCQDTEEAAPAVDAELEAYINAKIAERKEAKKNKDFATADAIRNELLEKHIAIKDTREGTVWEIVE